MALGTQPVGKLLDYEQYIEHQIRRTRARIKMTDMLTAGLILARRRSGVLFLEVVLDHIVRPAALVPADHPLVGPDRRRGVRRRSGSCCPLLGRVNGLYAARTIEEADPAFKNSLINYLDLRRHRDEISKAVLAAVEAKAVNDLTQVEIDTVVNQRRLSQMAYVLLGRRRALLPLRGDDAQEHPRLDPPRLARRRRPADQHPARQHQARRRPRAVAGRRRGARRRSRSRSRGRAPAASCSHYSVDGGKFFSTPRSPPGSNYYDPWQTTLRDVRQSLDYYLTGGDAESLQYHLEVVPAPMVTSVTRRLRVPRLHRRARRGKDVEGGNVEAIEGTVVTVHARTNEPAVSAYFEFSKGAGQQDPADGGVGRPTRSSLVGQVQGQGVGHVHDQVQDDRRPGQPRPGRLRHQRDPRQAPDRGRVPPARQARDQGAEQRQGAAPDDGRRRLRRQGRAAPRQPGEREPLLGQPAGEAEARRAGSRGRSRSTWPRRRSSPARRSSTG